MTPVYNEVNRIQVGNPVPIGGSESARAFNETQEALGKAIFDLGNALDNVKDKEDKERYRMEGRIAADKYAMQLMRNHQAERVNNTMADPTGVGTADTILAKTEPFRASLAESIDPKALPYFQEYATEEQRKQFAGFLTTGVEANQAKVKNDQNERFAGISEKARLDPGSLPAYLLETEIAVEEDGQIPNSQKDAVIREKQAGVVKSVSDMLKDSNQFDVAKNVLMKHRTMFDTDKLDTELADIDKRKLEFINTEYTSQKRNIEAAQELLRANDLSASRDYIDRIAKAGNNTAAQKLIDQQIAKDPRLTAESKINLTKQKTLFSDVADDEYQFKFIDNLIKTSNFKTAEDTLIRDKAANKVSTERAIKLQDFLKNMKEQQGRNPYLLKLVDQGAKEIASYAKISMQLDPVTGMQKPVVDQANERAQTAYRTAVANAVASGKDITADFINGQVTLAVSSLNETRAANIKGVNPVQMDTLDKISNTQKDLAKKIMEAKKKGTLTPDMIKKSTEQFRQLQQQKQKLERTEQTSIKPSAPTQKTKIFDE